MSKEQDAIKRQRDDDEEYLSKGREMRDSKPDRDHDRRENTFDLLEEGLAHISDAWTCLYEASRWEVYYEPDEQDIRRITDELIKLESKLEQVVRKYR